MTELLYFNVSDSSRNLLPNQVLSVFITPQDNQSPMVAVGPDIEVITVVTDLTGRKEGRKEMFYLTMHSTHFIYGYMGERNVLFNDALNTFYLRLYGVRHMVKDHSDSEKGNPLPPHRLLFPISSKGSFICTIPQTG